MSINTRSLPKARKNPQDGRWRIQLSLGRTPGGERKRKVFTAATKAAVEAKAKNYVATHGPFDTPPTGRTVETYLSEWFASRQANWRPRTKELYGLQIEQHIVPAIGNTSLEELTPIDVQGMLNSIVGAGKVPTANKVRRLLFGALKQAVRWRLIASNPVEAVDPIREEPAESELLAPAEAKRFLHTVSEHRLGTLFLVLIATGMRRGEVLGLRWSDVKDNGVRVEQTLVLVDNKPTISKPKTRLGRRFITLDADVLSELRAYRERQAAERKACGRAWAEHGLVFTTQIGTPIHPRNLRRVLDVHLEKAGLPKIRLHDLRHLHASLLIAAGIDAKSISERLGHASTSFTLDRYGHIFNEHRERSALPMAKLLGDNAPDGLDGPVKALEQESPE
ncbi:MAG: site-specific integrase [Thioalkalivibrio sp.]|nr:site-specific integrase [Thioalkalivibrio sp.]